MTGSFDYRSVRPELSSSSPLANLHDLSSSEPISPGSPTPSRSAIHPATFSRANGLFATTNSHPDPFSANAKASPNAHPSFGKNQLRQKHLRDSPSGARAGIAEAARPENVKREETLAHHFFDSSDDNLSSDPGTFSLAAAGTSRSSMTSVSNTSGSHTGLGLGQNSALSSAIGPSPVLGEPFREPVSPTLGKFKHRPFKRNMSSTHDPFSGTANLYPMHASTSYAADVNRRAEVGSGSPNPQRNSRRRRLVGTSPKKLSRAEKLGHFSNRSESDSDDAATPEWEQKVPAPSRSRFDWQAEIRKVFDKGGSLLVLDNRAIASIDPAIADLAKYVSFKIPSTVRAGEEMTATAMPPSSSQSSLPWSRNASLTSAAERLTQTDSATSSPTRTRSSNTITQNVSNGPQLNVANNLLQSLPSALFSVVNLTMLSLRGNNIKVLPAAIGQLTNLRELNVSSCELRYLPAEIQKLRLVHLFHFPNKFLPLPSNAELEARREYGCHGITSDGSDGIISNSKDTYDSKQDREEPPPTSTPGSMGPPAVPTQASRLRFDNRASFAASASLHRQSESSPGIEEAPLSNDLKVVIRILEQRPLDKIRLPSLQELCYRRLLKPNTHVDDKTRPLQRTFSSNGQRRDAILLERYEAGSLSRLDQAMNYAIIKKLEAARRSAAETWDQYRPGSSRQDTWCTGAHYTLRHRQGSIEPGVPKDVDDMKMKEFDGSSFFFDDVDEGEASAELSTDDDSIHPVAGEGHRAVDIEQQLDLGDDAAHNPWFNRCPNPLHVAKGQPDVVTSTSSAPVTEQQQHIKGGDWPQSDDGRLFDKPCVERFEWVSHVAGVKVATNLNVSPDQTLGVLDANKQASALKSGCTWLPILWRGCGPGCLDFLERVE